MKEVRIAAVGQRGPPLDGAAGAAEVGRRSVRQWTDEPLRGETLAAQRNIFDAPNTVAPQAVTSWRAGGARVLELAPASVTAVLL
jgi:hypothetical protein